MRTYPSRIVSHGRLAWLLWLALLLPIAQATATVHALSHTATHAGGAPDDKRAPHAADCALCLTAATVGGAAPARDAARVPAPAARQALASAVSRAFVPAEIARAYRSRAPPALSS